MKSGKLVLAILVMAVMLGGQSWAQEKTIKTSQEEVVSLLAFMYGDYFFGNAAATYNRRIDEANAKDNGQREHLDTLKGADLAKEYIAAYRAGAKDYIVPVEGMASELPVKAPMAVKIDLLEAITTEYIAGYEKYKVK